LGDPRLKLPKPLWSAPSELCQDGRSFRRAVRLLLIAAVYLSLLAPSVVAKEKESKCGENLKKATVSRYTLTTFEASKDTHNGLVPIASLTDLKSLKTKLKLHEKHLFDRSKLEKDIKLIYSIHDTRDIRVTINHIGDPNSCDIEVVLVIDELPPKGIEARERLKLLRETVRIYPNSPRYNGYLAQYEFQAGNDTEALRRINTAIALQEKNGSAEEFDILGDMLVVRANVRLAEYVPRPLEDRVSKRLHLPDSEIMRKLIPTAKLVLIKQDLIQSIKIMPENDAYWVLAWIYVVEGSNQDAVRVSKEGLTMNPINKDVYRRFIRLLSDN